MRILHFCSSFSRLSETFIYDLIAELERQGTDNHVLTFDRIDPDTRPFSKVTVVRKASRLHPARIIRRVLAGVGVTVAPEAGWSLERRRISAALEEIKPDMIHAHFGPAGVHVAPVAQQFGIPLAVSFHGQEVTRLAREEFWQTKYRELWPAAAAISGVSEHICGRLRELGAPADKLFRISNGVNLETFTYQNPAERFDGRNVECLFVGRLVEKKGPLLLVMAFEIAKQRLGAAVNLILHVIGDGPLRPALEVYCKQNGLEDSVHIHGPKNHLEVAAMMHRVHIYVQHSVTAADGDQEGQPVALIEAAASGLPIISTEHSGIPEIVLNEKTGFLVKEMDIERMGERLAFLTSQPTAWEEMGRLGREHVETNMRIDTQASRWLHLYQKVGNQRDR